MKPNLNEKEKVVLFWMADALFTYGEEGCCLNFRYLCKKTELDRKVVRRACRSLSRKGLAEYARGLFNMDLGVAGAGYMVTKEGVQWLEDGGKK